MTQITGESIDRLIAVGCTDVADFLSTYYRPNRYKGRGEEYAAGLLASAQARFEQYGHTLISRHDSTLGQAVWYYGTAADAAQALFVEAERLADRAAHLDDAAGRLRARSFVRQAKYVQRLAARSA